MYVVDLPKADRTFVEWARYHQVLHQSRWNWHHMFWQKRTVPVSWVTRPS